MTPPLEEVISQLRSADLVIVGSGFFGSTIANLASENQDKKIVVLEKRNHIGGNAFTYIDDQTGIEIHKYGSHLFHTSNEKVWRFVNQFDTFTEYKHQVFTYYKEQAYSFPFNLMTINQFYKKFYTPQEARALIQAEIDKEEKFNADKSLETKSISLVGRPLYEAFIKDYTAKQWDLDPKLLPADIISRIPIRYNFNSRYFSDTYEGLPTHGYTYLINQILDRPNISVYLESDFFDLRQFINDKTLVVYSGPIDRFFNFQYGLLNWRTLDFDFKIEDISDFQGNSVMNYAEKKYPFTRIHEFRHLHPERNYKTMHTVLAYEYSRIAAHEDEPYYPVNDLEDRQKLKKYREMAELEKSVVFGGRLGSYQYLDMHMAIASAFSKFESDVKGWLQNQS